MGMDIDAHLFIGAIVSTQAGTLNSSYDEEEHEAGFLEYLEGIILEDEPAKKLNLDIQLIGSYECSTYAVSIGSFYGSASWDYTLIDSIPDMEEIEDKVQQLKGFLENNNIEYGDIGLLLISFFSY